MNNPTTTVKLSEVADVILGQTFRGKAESSAPEGKVQLIQIKNLVKGIISETKPLPFANIDDNKLKVWLKPNDILLPLRGGRIVASLYLPKESNILVTAINQVAIIRVSSTKLTINYLLWYLNSEYGSHLLSQLVRGATIQSINKNDLSGLEIRLPDVSTQQKISDLYLNWLAQEKTLKEMIDNTGKLTEKYCNEIATGVRT